MIRNMNYRQWKKNYKKMHGCNPPIEVDKRKQVKAIRKCIISLYESDYYHWSIFYRKKLVLCEKLERFPMNFKQRKKVWKGLNIKG